MIDDIFTKHGDDPVIQEYIDILSYPISTEITILDPDYVLMAGGVMIMKDFPMERLLYRSEYAADILIRQRIFSLFSLSILRPVV